MNGKNKTKVSSVPFGLLLPMQMLSIGSLKRAMYDSFSQFFSCLVGLILRFDFAVDGSGYYFKGFGRCSEACCLWTS